MNDLPRLTENDIRRLATTQSFTRGEDYYASGAVFDTQRRGETLIAQVEGSQYEPYQVTITLDVAGVQDTDCTCPYNWGGICKHIVAVLLTYIHEPDSFTVSQREAEGLINRVQSKYYQAAVRWLERARAAYQSQGQERAWRNYLRDLRQRHGRKRTLLAMLDRMESGRGRAP